MVDMYRLNRALYPPRESFDGPFDMRDFHRKLPSGKTVGQVLLEDIQKYIDKKEGRSK